MVSGTTFVLLSMGALGLSACSGKAQSYVNEREGARLDLRDDGKAIFAMKDGSTMELGYSIVGRDADGQISRVAIGLGNDMEMFTADDDTGCLRASKMRGEFCPN